MGSEEPLQIGCCNCDYALLLVDRYQVSGLLVAKLHVIAQHVYVQQLPDILLLVILCNTQRCPLDIKLNRCEVCANQQGHQCT